jgi:hypothetical protein
LPLNHCERQASIHAQLERADAECQNAIGLW